VVVRPPDGARRPADRRRPVIQAAAQAALDPDIVLRFGGHVPARCLPADAARQL
ncbi:hypothetical protein, partial [Arthrobacter sp. DR-2P]